MSSFRYMRVLLFYDLPVTESKLLKAANDFRKNIVKEGFIAMQESVYCKLLINDTSMALLKQRIKKLAPSEGSVFMLTVKERQFERMEFLVGDRKSDVLDTTSRLVII